MSLQQSGSPALPPPHVQVGTALMLTAEHATHRARLHATRSTGHSALSPQDPNRFSHLTSRRKAAQLAAERAAQVEHDNLLLVERLRMVLVRKQVDNVASGPATAARSLNARARAQQQDAIDAENARMQRRLAATRGVLRSADLRRAGAESEQVIARHCQYPRQDPLTYRAGYYADPSNPYMNWMGGQQRITPAVPAAARPGTGLIGWDRSSEEAKSNDAFPPRLLMPNPPHRRAASTSSAASARPSALTSHSPLPPQLPHRSGLIAHDPLLLQRRRPASADFQPLGRLSTQHDPLSSQLTGSAMHPDAHAGASAPVQRPLLSARGRLVRPASSVVKQQQHSRTSSEPMPFSPPPITPLFSFPVPPGMVQQHSALPDAAELAPHPHTHTTNQPRSDSPAELLPAAATVAPLIPLPPPPRAAFVLPSTLARNRVQLSFEPTAQAVLLQEEPTADDPKGEVAGEYEVSEGSDESALAAAIRTPLPPECPSPDASRRSSGIHSSSHESPN